MADLEIVCPSEYCPHPWVPEKFQQLVCAYYNVVKRVGDTGPHEPELENHYIHAIVLTAHITPREIIEREFGDG